jgi:hypothetical protein
MERSVIETFEVLQPDVQPIFHHESRECPAIERPCWRKCEAVRITVPLLQRHRDWPRFGKPRSCERRDRDSEPRSSLGNLDVLRAARDADALYLPIVTSAYISVLAALWFRLRGRKVIYFFHDLPARVLRKLRPAVALSTDLVHYTQRSLAWRRR